MLPFRRSGHVEVYFVFFAGFALAMLQNVSVDDAVLTGAVVPQYLPTDSVWNIGNNCTTCVVKPDPTMAYNGTWHDTTYDPGNNYTQAIEFTFTGNALYIFFIIANSDADFSAFTDVDFVLDHATVGRYTHTQSSSTDYQYNVPVYVNESMGLGEHNMMIQPVDSGNHVLMLFDYFIYTMDVSVSSSASPYSTSSPSPTMSRTATSLSPNIGAIVGGILGGVVAVALVAISLLCYRRHEKRSGGEPSNSPMPVEEWALPVVEPFILPNEVAQAPLAGTASSTYPNTLMGFLATEHASRSKTDVSSVVLRPSIPRTSTTASSSPVSPSSGNNDALLEQVELLKDEVALLRNLHGADQHSLVFRSETPPEYS